jgi:hypothetical protein
MRGCIQPDRPIGQERRLNETLSKNGASSAGAQSLLNRDKNQRTQSGLESNVHGESNSN